jgi:tryptophan synthase alpha subunit
LEAGANGVIVGSALVRIIEEHTGDEPGCTKRSAQRSSRYAGGSSPTQHLIYPGGKE